MFKIRKAISSLSFLLAIGMIQRLLTFIFCYSKFSSTGDALVSLLSGSVYDLSASGILFLVYFVFSGLFRRKIVQHIYLGLIFFWVVLAAFDVYSLYYNGVRASTNSFNLFKLADLADKFDLSAIHAGFFVVLAAGLWLCYRWRHVLVPQVDLQGWKQKIIYVLMLFALSLLYLPFPLNYYNDQLKISKEAKQLAIHPFFSWGTSLMYSDREYFMDPELALIAFKNRMDYHGQGNDFLQRPVNYTDSSANPVILIVMESFGANRIGALQGKKSLSPAFDSLCREGVLYTKCFASGPRTQFAVSSIFYGFPHILGYNLFRENKQKFKFSGLTDLLGRNGYACHFLHGGHAGYDDMSLFINADGRLDLKDVRDIGHYKFSNAWGIDDGSFLSFSANYIASGQGKNFYGMLTMSNHEPFQLPFDFKLPANARELSPAEKTFLYSDNSLGEFIRQLKQSGIYEKALIIITGDHGERYSDDDAETKLYHVPLLVIDHLRKNGRDSLPCSHADIAEYILSKTGFKGNSHLVGRGLTDKRYKMTFYRGYDEDICMVTDSVIYRYHLRRKTLEELTCFNSMYVQSSRQLPLSVEAYKRIAREMLAYYTANKFIFENGLYHGSN